MITALELVKDLEQICKAKKPVGQGYLLTDKLKAEKDKVYLPLDSKHLVIGSSTKIPSGSLNLPVFEEFSCSSDFHKPAYHRLRLSTVFSYCFLDDIPTLRNLFYIPWDKGEKIKLDRVFGFFSESKSLKNEPLNPEDLIQQHLQRFFEFYKKAESYRKASEPVECIKKCFTPYKRGVA